MRSVLIMDSDHLVLSALATSALAEELGIESEQVNPKENRTETNRRGLLLCVSLPRPVPARERLSAGFLPPIPKWSTRFP